MNNTKLTNVTEIKAGDIIDVSGVIGTVTAVRPYGDAETKIVFETDRAVLNFIFSNDNWFTIVRLDVVS